MSGPIFTTSQSLPRQHNGLLTGVMLLALALFWSVTPLWAASFKLVVVGDSLSAGYGLPPGQSFPDELEKALKKRGREVKIINAGVSGDTTSGGLARLDWAIPANADGVIVELGANDALRGVSPSESRKNLDEILYRLKKRGLPVLLAGMEAPRNMGPDYTRQFKQLFYDLAQKHKVVFYPFFLDGVVLNPSLNQADGIHPNKKGVAVIVRKILPKVEELLARAAKGSS